MASKKKNDDAVTLDLSESGLQSFKMEKLHRSALKGAVYNPRLLTDAARRKLRTGMKRHGLVAPITWNRTTGNIVGGHQRLSQLDALAETDNYQLDVAVIEVSEIREKELNLLLNNYEAQGDFDLEGLQTILRTTGLDLDGTGFDHSDIFKLFGDSMLVERDDAALDQFAQKVRDMRKVYNGISSGQNNRNSDDFYMVVVFRDAAHRDAFIARFKLEDNRYQSGEEIERLCSASEKVSEGT